MPWSAEDASNELWCGLDTSGINGEVHAYLRKHLTAAFNAGRRQEAESWWKSRRIRQENAMDDMTEVEKRIVELKRIVGHDSYIDTSFRHGRPDRQVIYGDEAMRALAEIDILRAHRDAPIQVGDATYAR